MEIRHLNHFLAVLDAGSLGRAAKAIGISEPALSKSIRRLEDLLQVQLLDRGTRGMTPTVFGESLAIHARLVTSEIGRAMGALGELKGTGRGVVRVGARPSFGAVILPRAIARLHAARPGVRVSVREGKPGNLVREVMHGDLDFAIVTQMEEPLDESLVQEPLLASPVAVVARSDHPLQLEGTVPVSALVRYPWIVTPSPHSARIQLERLFARHDLGPVDIAAESDSVLFIMSFLRVTDSLSFFPMAMIEEPPADGTLRAIDVAGMRWRRQLGLVRRRRAGLAPAAQLLLEELRRAAAELGKAFSA